MPRRAMAYATAPPSSVVAGQSYTVSVTITNQSTLLRSPVAYPFVVRFYFYVQAGYTNKLSSTGAFSIEIVASGQAPVSYTFTVPASGYTIGYIKVALRNTLDTAYVGTTLQSSNFTIAAAEVIPGGSIAW